MWAGVKTGLFGMNESLVPLYGAQMRGDQLRVAYEKARVKDAPNVDTDPDEPLDIDQVADLYRHYDIGWDQAGTDTYAGGYTAGATHTRDAFERSDFERSDFERSDFQTADRERTGEAYGRDAMTRSEERLDVGSERERVGKAKLRKYVVTDHVRTTVPVQREESRLEREPITDATRIGRTRVRT
jgi:stress response protein YsnF